MNISEKSLPTIGLIGYGKMGREIEQAAHAAGMTINAIIDLPSHANTQPLDRDALDAVDVCIEFTVPSAVVDNIRAIAAMGKNMVVGTTGWYEHLDEVRAIVEERGIGLICATNFSIGVHLFLALVREAGRIFNAHPQYDASVLETHHKMKLDAPSGTAISTAAVLMGTLTRKTQWTTHLTGEVLPESTLHIASSRVGHVPGTHSVVFDSLSDSIELTHTARGRRGLAEGALLAARWIRGKKGLFSIEEMLHELEAV